jgi:hypothetical protein
MDARLEFLGFISVLELEWINSLQFIIDLFQQNFLDLSKASKEKVILNQKVLSHRVRVWPQQIITSARVTKIKKLCGYLKAKNLLKR